MKSITSTRLTLVFLMVLYIAPMILAPSYSHTAIPTEENMVKDFSPSAGEGWFDEDWAYRKSGSITGSAGAGINYQVRILISYVSHMQTDFDDVRFTDDGGINELDYWIESYVVSGYAIFWVNVTDDLDSNQDIYMYYGNSEVSTTSNGTATFLFYEDWSTETIEASRWTTITSDGSFSFDDTDAQHGSVLKLEGTAGTNVYEIRSVVTGSASISLIGRMLIENTVVASQRTIWGMGSQAQGPLALVRSVDGVEQFLGADDDANADDDPLGAGYFDVYQRFMITRNGTDARLYSDATLIATVDVDPDTTAREVAMLMVRDSEYDLYCDWNAARKFTATEPEFDSFCDEELFSEFTPVEWHSIGDATLFLSVLFDMWGFDTGLIILGLIMIPVSMLYLAYGVKHDRSDDRLFYGLIIFFLGCGLFVGGIMP